MIADCEFRTRPSKSSEPIKLGIKCGDHRLFFFREGPGGAVIVPAVAPPIPVWIVRRASDADAGKHQFGKLGVAGFLQETLPKSFVGRESCRLGAAFPVGEVMFHTAISPIHVT